MVLVPFYRGAVVFDELTSASQDDQRSRPLLSRSGCISSDSELAMLVAMVLVPFYRGAVVFLT